MADKATGASAGSARSDRNLPRGEPTAVEPRPGDDHRAPKPRRNTLGYRWLLVALILLLVPVAVISVRQATDRTEAGRIATHPPADLFAKPLEGTWLPGEVGDRTLTRREDGPILPHGQHDSVDYLSGDGTDPMRVVLVEGRVTSQSDYEAASGLRDIRRFDRFSCGWTDRLGQCVGLLRGGYLVTIAMDPATGIDLLAEFSNELYEALPEP
ncbi:hypothetical protein [Granulicoccus sp. GXG6511]|uniref:hypothetical protein n=1 Tax=Granulicoccus sp. GXG6511 TaxID=3381351 RepID=UPI003D7DFFB9